MMNRADNELLTRIARGTPMGAMLREYWVPACRSARLEADGAPEKVRLFGDNFVAFRVSDGPLRPVMPDQWPSFIAWRSCCHRSSGPPMSALKWSGSPDHIPNAPNRSGRSGPSVS